MPDVNIVVGNDGSNDLQGGEANETFFVALRPTNGAGVSDGLATGTIANDAGG